MREETIVKKLTESLRLHGRSPLEQYNIGGRRADIAFEVNGQLVAIEVKGSTGDPFTGLGQALGYLEDAQECWLVMPARLIMKVYPIVQRFQLPAKLLNTKDIENLNFIEILHPKEEKKARYACLFCSESFPDRAWSLRHMNKQHGFDLTLYKADMDELAEYRRKTVEMRKKKLDKEA